MPQADACGETSNTVAGRSGPVQTGSGHRVPATGPCGQTGGMVGSTGRVTGRVGAGLVGEVLVLVAERGGTEAFLAYPALPGDELAPGAPVVVVEYQPPRTVYVAPL